MKSNKLIRIGTMLSFVILIAVFVVYKTNYLNVEKDNSKQDNLKGDSIKASSLDSSNTKKIDSIQSSPTMMSTSKSVILKEMKIKFPEKIHAKKSPSK